MTWWRRLLARFRKEPWKVWVLWYLPDGAEEPVILGDIEGTYEEAMDAAQCAAVNWMWKSGAFNEGKAAFGKYGAMAAKRYGKQLVPDTSPPPETS